MGFRKAGQPPKSKFIMNCKKLQFLAFWRKFNLLILRARCWSFDGEQDLVSALREQWTSTLQCVSDTIEGNSESA